jgi:hypothetical protein
MNIELLKIIINSNTIEERLSKLENSNKFLSNEIKSAYDIISLTEKNITNCLVLNERITLYQNQPLKIDIGRLQQSKSKDKEKSKSTRNDEKSKGKTELVQKSTSKLTTTDRDSTTRKDEIKKTPSKTNKSKANIEEVQKYESIF